MERPLECKTLLEILGEIPACHDTCSATYTPSYKDDSILKGCLIAHVTLTLIEMQRIASCFKAPLHKMFIANKVEKNIKQTKDDVWNIILSTSFLHDVGKLADQYINTAEKHVRHHRISAIIARKTLREIFDDFIAIKVAYAILFHHEAIDWKTVEQSTLFSSYLQAALHPLSRVSYTVSHNRLSLFERNLCEILDQIQRKNIITQLQYSFLVKTLNYAIQELINNQGVNLKADQELNVEKVQEPKYIAPALAIYRFIYLIDNRAASARSEYWFKLVQQVNWNELESVAYYIQKYLTRRYYYIGLSAIP